MKNLFVHDLTLSNRQDMIKIIKLIRKDIKES